MTTQTTVIAAVLGAALIALWLDARFPGAAPPGKVARIAHFAAALACVELAPFLMSHVPGVREEAMPATVALLGIFFPALAYIFLNGIWFIRMLQGAVRLG